MWRATASVTLAMAAVCSIGGATHAAPPGPITAADDAASVDLLDDAILELASGNDARYELLLKSAVTGAVWLPVPAIDAVLDRDANAIETWAQIIDADPFVLLDDAAYAVIEGEQEAVDLLDDALTEKGMIDVDDADMLGAGTLEVIDRRGISIASSTRLVLMSIADNGDDLPSNAQYRQALDDLDIAIAQLEDPPPIDGVDVQVGGAVADLGNVIDGVDDSSDGDLSTSQSVGPDVDTTASEPSPAATTPAIPAASSGSSAAMPLSMMLTLGVAGFALLTALFAIAKGRKSDDLADIAFTDALTGLKNRRRLDSDVAAQRSAGQRSTATLMVDVDHFKKFNDDHGHAVGDEVLRRVGEALSAEFRRKDVPYRYGGEEFCVILTDTTHDEALVAGERARRAIHDIELPVPGVVTASVGVSTGPSTGVTETIKRADKALYEAKAAGRNRVAHR